MFGSVRVPALNNVGTALVFRDRPEGIELLEQSLALALKNENHEHAARVYTNLAEYGIEFMNFALAERVIGDGIVFDTHHDLNAWTHYLAGRLAQLRMKQGRLRDAETIASGVLKLDRLTLLMQLPALTVLARVRLRLGENNARELLSKALQNAAATDEPQYIIPARFALIEAAWLYDVPESALEHLHNLVELGISQMHPWNIGELAVWAQRLGFDLPDDYRRDLPAPWAAEIQGDCIVAANAWEILGAPYSAALCLMHTEGEETGAAIVRAVRLLDPMEATPAAMKARAIASSLGLSKQMPRVRRGPYRAAKSHPLGLTRREQDILALLTNGATNRDISETLARSQRTIEHHVSSVLSKLNVANRMEAMLRVQNEPWLLPEDGAKK